MIKYLDPRKITISKLPTVVSISRWSIRKAKGATLSSTPIIDAEGVEFWAIFTHLLITIQLTLGAESKPSTLGTFFTIQGGSCSKNEDKRFKNRVCEGGLLLIVVWPGHVYIDLM